ncbi:glycosyl hydrolase catalytic core-domain-containing protein [Dactylonectria estremocensis]|uniref:Glycosyl hydrolase catalytic core-domain-containing protein n=1 Tax=Dactylonectria estremocensis TaxID=1079267 RepID=A0A9P9F782_9HYPO|nr:glycosyl hydrolase catalytic core-domain-containing protein [Dactylonectria estremocensis]
MVSKKCVLLSATAALVESALGFNYRRHGHQHIDKRAYETDWVTEWVTVWVTAGQDAAAVTTKAGSNKYKNKGTTTSTTVVVVPTSTSVAYVAPVQTTSVAYVEPAQTTLTAVLKPETTAAAVVYTSSSIEEVAAVPDTTSAVVVEEVAATTQKAAATTTSKKAAATTASSSSSSGLSHKRGMAYNEAALANTFGASCANCGWAYAWSSVSTGSEDLDSTYNFIPMLWGNASMFVDVWDDNAAAAISSGSKALFSFNEPDIPTQANLIPADAAGYHVEFMNPYAGQAKIGAPSVSNSGSEGQGLDWLSSWIDTCKTLDEPCHYDFCNVHWYSEAAYADTLFTHLEDAYKLCGKPIWLTEFAPNHASEAETAAFLEEVIPKLEALDYLEGYAYWMVATGNLMSSDSSLSTYGQVYASA